MDDYISRQVAISAAIKMFNAWYGHSWLRTNEIRAMFEQLPSADAQPVVRCKDCKWFNNIGCAIEIMDESDKPQEDDFCSFAERKEDG